MIIKKVHNPSLCTFNYSTNLMSLFSPPLLRPHLPSPSSLSLSSSSFTIPFLSFCSYFLPSSSLLSILFQPFLLFLPEWKLLSCIGHKFTTRILMIAFIDCLLYAKRHSKLFVYIFILTSSMYYCSESEASNNLPKFTKPIRNK